ncbi:MULTISPECIES: hypothetical protein [Variovorax]|jgi:hypothetical protein|uniref:hypothetical protein n=1 Tax=Variovorax TaxID=34072 RepID=UPI001F3DD830|nr:MULTISPECIES: hypothetical protein [Variovorax]UKI10726.1 hypothetical protein L3V85_13020 [Variovorax paradoxus]
MLASLKISALQRENSWRDYGFSPSYLADFVLSELAVLSVDEYSLQEIFSKPAIQALLSYSCKSINAYRSGSALSSLGSGGVVARPSDEGRKLEMLLRSWAGKGWIFISEVDGENSFIAELME